MKKTENDSTLLKIEKLNLKLWGKFLTVRFVMISFFVCVMAISGFLTYLIFWVLKYFEVYDISKRPSAFVVLLSLGASFILATVTAFIFSFWMLRPMDVLIKATQEVANGNFKVRISTKGCHGEFKVLVRSFNDMIAELSGIEIFRKNFINIFSHEFKTPIISVKGFAEQLMREDLTEEERSEYRHFIVRESEKLTKLSTNVLLLSKLESQEIVAEKVEYRLDEQIRNCILMFQKQWEEKGLELDLRLEPVHYYGNREILRLLWNNLISNAIKFSRQGGKMLICCRMSENSVEVSVSDNGVGMSEEVKTHIFETFYRGENKQLVNGSGLGLPIVKRIVELCEGTIQVKSEEGRGSVFLIMLPIEK